MATPAVLLSQMHVDILYAILHRFDGAATHARCPYTMAAGTALGAVRHGGLIPWDDDGDLYVRDTDFQRAAIALYYECAKAGLHLRQHMHADGTASSGWYKVYLGDHTFPNVDLFLMKQDESDGCWRFSDPHARAWWPKEYVSAAETRQSTRVPFGPLRLPLFGNAPDYLTRCYGADWAVVAWDGWDHANERRRPHRANERHISSYEPALPTGAFRTIA